MNFFRIRFVIYRKRSSQIAERKNI